MARPEAIVPVTSGRKYMRLLVYGDPGVGKSVFAGTSPKALILDADQGSESMATSGSKADKWDILDYNDLDEAYQYLRHAGQREFDWVWLDGITLFQERGLDHVMRDLVARAEHRKLWLPDKGEYGANMNRLMLYVRWFKSLKMHVGFTAHTLRMEDDEGEIIHMPFVQGKNMPDKVCGHMNMVAYMYTKERKVKGQSKPKEVRLIRTAKDSKHYAKDRFGLVKPVLLEPTVPQLMAAVQEKLPRSRVRRTAAKRTQRRRRSAA